MTEYIIGTQGPPGPPGEQGEPGPQGIQGGPGVQGTPGQEGASFALQGTVPTYAALPQSDQFPGYAYVTNDTGKLWIWVGNRYVDAGQFRGFHGTDGAPGAPGQPGAPGESGAPGPPGDTVDLSRWVTSRENNLISNGNGYLRDLTNFTQFQQLLMAAPPLGVTAGFIAHTQNGTVATDDRVPLPIDEEFQFKFFIKQTESNFTAATFRAGVAPYDADGNAILPEHYAFRANTTTTLATDLLPGAGTIALTSSTNWQDGADPDARGIMIWTYVDQAGTLWPAHTYTRVTSVNAWSEGAINRETHVITLSRPWEAGLIPAGTMVSNSLRGPTHPYAYADIAAGTAWSEYKKSFVFKHIGIATAATGQAPVTWDTGFPLSTVAVKPVWVLNIGAEGSRHAIAGVQLSTTAALGARTQEALEAAESLQVDLTAASARLTLAETELDAAKDDIFTAQTSLQQAQTDAAAAVGQSSQAVQDAQNAWNKALEVEMLATEAAQGGLVLEVSSSSGTIFKDTAIASTLTAHVYKGGQELSAEEISALGIIRWYKDGSTTPISEGATLIVSSGQVDAKATYEARLEK